MYLLLDVRKISLHTVHVLVCGREAIYHSQTEKNFSNRCRRTQHNRFPFAIFVIIREYEHRRFRGIFLE